MNLYYIINNEYELLLVIEKTNLLFNYLQEEQTPLHVASRLGNVDIVMLLLQHGAGVDATTKDLYTPLHIAAKEGQEEVKLYICKYKN